MSDTQETVVIDEEGDVVLIVGDEKKRLRVSSKTMQLASKVFRVMFSDKFKEGNELRANAFLSPIEVPLPEDDAEAMALVCKALHFKNNDLPSQVDLAVLHSTAFLVDKYDCVQAFKFVTEVWLSAANKSASLCPEQALLLTEAAWLFDNARAFTSSTKTLILNMSNYAPPGSAGHDKILPECVLLALAKRLSKAVKDLTDRLGRPLTSLSGLFIAKPHKHEHNLYGRGLHEIRSMYNYVVLLKRHGLIMDGDLNLTVTTLLSKIKKCLADGDMIELTASDGSRIDCNACQFNCKGHLESIIKSVEEVDGLCLDCVRAEREDCIATCRKID